MNEHARRELEPPATLLKRGDKGPKVEQAQEWLCFAGFHTAVDGDFGPATEAALKAFQDHMEQRYSPESKAWGEVDAETWAALTEPLRRVAEWKRAPGFYATNIVLDCAYSHLFAQPREVGKPNGGPWVRYYCRWLEVPWCAGFATTVLGQALGHDEWYTLSCDELGRRAARQRRLVSNNPRPGDLFLIRNPAPDQRDDWIHTGIVTAVGADYFETIEGNTNTDGNREGTAVHARVRAFRPNVDFVLTGER